MSRQEQAWRRCQTNTRRKANWFRRFRRKTTKRHQFHWNVTLKAMWWNANCYQTVSRVCQSCSLSRRPCSASISGALKTFDRAVRCRSAGGVGGLSACQLTFLFKYCIQNLSSNTFTSKQRLRLKPWLVINIFIVNASCRWVMNVVFNALNHHCETRIHPKLALYLDWEYWLPFVQCGMNQPWLFRESVLVCN